MTALKCAICGGDYRILSDGETCECISCGALATRGQLVCKRSTANDKKRAAKTRGVSYLVVSILALLASVGFFFLGTGGAVVIAASLWSVLCAYLLIPKGKFGTGKYVLAIIGTAVALWVSIAAASILSNWSDDVMFSVFCLCVILSTVLCFWNICDGVNYQCEKRGLTRVIIASIATAIAASLMIIFCFTEEDGFFNFSILIFSILSAHFIVCGRRKVKGAKRIAIYAVSLPICSALLFFAIRFIITIAIYGI